MMEMNVFAKWVKHNNHSDYRNSILAMIGFACIFFCYTALMSGNGIGYLLAGGVLLVIAALEIGRYHWDTYLNLSEAVMMPGSTKSISEILRMHAFPVDAYFKYVSAKMVLPSALIAICSVTMLALATMEDDGDIHYQKEVILLLGLVCICCPFLAGVLKKKWFLHQLAHGKEGGLNFVAGIAVRIVRILDAIFLVVTVPIAAVIIWAVITDFIAPPVEETKIVFRNYTHGMSFIFLLGFLFAGMYALCSHITKWVTKLLYVLSIVSLLTAVILTVYESHVYTEFAGDQLIVCHFGEKRVYGMDEIEHFRIYEENGSIQLLLEFKDGVEMKTIGPMQTYSTLYGERYYSEYNFIADYIGKLHRLGIEGELEDVEALETYVADLDVQLKEGLREIVEQMERID